MSRPFFKDTIALLEETVKQHFDDLVILGQINEELQHRSTSRAKDLQVDVAELIKQEQQDAQERANFRDKNMKTSTAGISETVTPKTEKKRQYPDGFLKDNFQSLRNKLLDTAGGRSRLLNLDQSKKSFVRAVDELPNSLAKILLAEKAMRIVPVPEPTLVELLDHGYLEKDKETDTLVRLKPDPSAKEWAAIKGINNDFELPTIEAEAEDARHFDTDVQTLLYEPLLNKNLKALAKDANTAIEETGNNILFLSIGFLEYTDQSELNGTARKRQAPLFMVPVLIEKKVVSNVTHFFIKYTGEDIIENLTLREKLVQDYEIFLPRVYRQDEDGTLLDPESYFEEVTALLARKDNDPNIRQWRVRRFATLATLSLGKLLMYKDLDPEAWPDNGAALLEHELISSFFSETKKQGGAGLRTETHDIDKMPSLHHDFPMIEDADSSQMSALIDALNGENIVIEGPPGTGKSQTITNLIAAALSQKKSVLFVAEKQAALDVVKRRLDNAGLGDFCLDLHSDKAQKKKVHDAFNKRMANHDSFQYSVDEYNLQVNRYERTRDELQIYVETVNKKWKNTGRTIHEILSSATRYAKAVAPLDYNDVKPDSLNGDTFSQFFLDDQLQQLEKFYDYVERVSSQLEDHGNWLSHPWAGVNNKALVSQPDSIVKKSLSNWQGDLANLFTALSVCAASIDVIIACDIQLDEFDDWLKEWSELPSLLGKEVFSSLNVIQEADLTFIEVTCQQIEASSKCYERLAATFHRSFLEDIHQVNTIKKSLDSLRELGIAESVSFDDLAAHIEQLGSLIKVFKSLNEDRVILNKSINESMAELLTPNIAGLKELACFVALVEKLPAEYISHRNDVYDDDVIDEAIRSFQNEMVDLANKRNALESIFKLEKIPDVETLKQCSKILAGTTFYSFFGATWRTTKKLVQQFCLVEKPDYKLVAEQLESAAVFLEAKAAIDANTFYAKSFEFDFDGVNTNIERVVSVREWYKKVRDEYGVGFGRRVPLASGVFNCSKDVFRGIQALGKNDLLEKISEFTTGMALLSEVFIKETCFSDPHQLLGQVADPMEAALWQIKENLKDVQKHLLDPNLRQSQLMSALQQVEKLKTLLAIVNEADLSTRFFEGRLDLTIPANGHLPKSYESAHQTLLFLRAIYTGVSIPALRALVISCASQDKYVQLVTLRDELDGVVLSERGSAEAFFEMIDSDMDQWLRGRNGSFESLVLKNETASTNFEWLDGWIKYLFAKERLDQGGFGNIKNYLLNNEHNLTYAKDVLNFACYRTVADEIYRSVPLLSEKSGHEQSAVQQQFAVIDEGLKVIQRKRVAALIANTQVPEGERGAKVSSYTEGALLTHEMGKKTKHVAIRRLVERAGRAMQAQMPCFMMSPMAVAKYIPPGSLDFDLVVMDEASQVKQEYALSCFARGKKVVVVGDPKQLPPTNFFEKSTSDGDGNGEDISVIQDSESILEAIGGFTPKRMLQWHYRSRHESLIAFSNYNFYDSRLIVFPSPWDQSEEFGVKHHYVEHGRFLTGVNQTESHAVVNAIVGHLMSSKESLGVVAMNSRQRDQIEADLEAAAQTDSALAETLALSRSSNDPFFIKNLENVQGDERDVIYISFTYGPAERGASAIPQRFGPINFENGWRRLNVLFTRAKKRKHVFTSMRSGQIVVSETSSRGVVALKDYLTFIETGRLAGAGKPTGKEPDSDFEVAVINALEKEGYQCEPQLGVEGYFIDLAVRDPGMPGRYLMGIECDGATYHRAKSTRDRDRVRQSVLEGLGWNIKRIWSTDWFRNPDAELKPIFDELKRLATPAVSLEGSAEVELDQVDLFRDEQHYELTKKYTESSVLDETLRERLLKFQEQVIARKFPDTEDGQRLLRPDILERLVEYEPSNKEEFAEFIPQYLRTSTDKEEAARCLDDILEIVSEFVEGKRYS
jgi:very-short-patch-repair endonuclease